MIVKKDNVERIIDEDELSSFQKLGYVPLEENEPQEEVPKKLSNMTVPELKALAEEKGIEGCTGLNKQELLKVLGDV